MKNELNAYRAVLLDIDDTLYDYKSAHSRAIEHVYDSLSVVLPSLSLADFLSRYRHHRTMVTLAHAGSGASRSRYLAFQALFEEVGLVDAYLHAAAAEDLYWDHLIEVMEPMQELIDALRKFHLSGGRICVVTDMQARIQVRKIERLGMTSYVDFLVSSEEAGCEKPDPRIFELALTKLGLRHHSVVMIGDSRTKDFLGAQKSRIDSWLISNGEVLEKNFINSSLSELSPQL